MKGILLIIFYLIISIYSYSQKYDNIWVRGTGSLSNVPVEYGTSFMDFTTNPPKITLGKKHPPLRNCVACISDSLGKLLFYTNLIQVYNSKEEILKNGDQINEGKIWNTFFDSGYPSVACAKILPIKNDSLFLMIYSQLHTDSLFLISSPMRYAIIDPYFQNNMGKVLLKDIPFHYGNSATYDLVKHGNGKDWWLIIGDRNIKDSIQQYYQFLITTSGQIDSISSQIFKLPPGIDGISRISKNGEKYVRYSFKDGFNSFSVFNIDRCSGKLIQLKNFIFSKIYNPYLFEISPNGRYVYPSKPGSLYQIDLESSDPYLFIDTTSIIDGYTENGFPPCFGQAQITPYDEIMIFPFQCNPKSINIIHQPDLPGQASDFEQHAIVGPNFALGTPLFPNYRLGALEGSPCDTIGFNVTNGLWQVDQDSIEICASSVQSPGFKKLIIRIYDLAGDNLLEEQFINQQSQYCLSTTSLIPGDYIYYLWVDDKKVLKGNIIIPK